MNDNTNPAATSGDAPDLQQRICEILYGLPREPDTSDLDEAAARIARIERTTAHVQPVNTSSERVENAAGNEQVERAAAPAPTAPFAWMKSNEIDGLLDAADKTTHHGEPVRQYGRIYARQYDADMVPVYAASPATASGDELPITDENAPGYRPPCCDGGGLGSPCCSGGVCVADRELAEMGIGRTCATVSAATKPTADLSSLQRYGLTMHEEGVDYMAQREEGNWVKFADVQSLLATKPAAAPAVPEGFVIVPKVPTRSMIAKTIDAVFDGAIEDASVIEEVYAAMLAATPAASTIGAAQTADQVREGCESCIGTYCLLGEVCRKCGHEAESQGVKRPTTTQNSEAGE